MRWRVLVLVVAAVVMAGCGSQGADTEPRQTTPSGAAACLNDDVVSGSQGLARVDLDGDGRPDAVNFFPGSGSCSNLLLSTLGGEIRAVKAPVDLALHRVKVSAISVPGR